MKGLQSLASVIVLLGLTVSVPNADAQSKAHLEESPVSIKINVNYLAKENKKSSRDLENAFALIESKDYKGALEIFSKVIETEPNNKYAYVGRGFANFGLANYQQAKVDLDKGISLDTSISYAYLFRGLAQYQLGNKPDAISDLQIAANLFKKEGAKEMEKNTLNQIEKIRKE